MKEIRKSTFREIKSSFGRFMAIFAIIALGVGFFAGLKVTKPAMVAAVKSYLDDHAFYDLRLVSTMGFESGAGETLREKEEVEAAESGVSLDVLYRLEDGGQGVLKAYSITESINRLEIVAGRMPQAANECVVDSDLFDSSVIGSVITLSEDNEEETLKSFRYSAYTVVGTVQSPLYIQFERGNTSLGAGRVNGFVYLSRDGFDMDYDTEIYVRFAQDNPLYGEEYQNFMEEREELWEEYAAGAADERYESILAEAYGELDEARQEFEEKKTEGENELADAAKTLSDARAELSEGASALEAARTELAEAEKTLSEKERELLDGKKTLAEKEQELSEGEAELVEAERVWEDGNAQVGASWELFLSQREQFAAQKTELETQAADIETQLAELASQESLLSAEAARLDGAEAMGVLTPEELAAARAQLEAGRQQLEAAKKQLVPAKQQIEAGRQQLAAYEAQLAGAESGLMQANIKINEGRQELDEAKAKLTEGRQALEEGRQEIADGERALDEAKTKLSEAGVTLAEKEAELADAEREVAEGEAEYADALKELEEKLAEGEAELADAEKELRELERPEVFVLGRNTNVGYVCFENDANIVAGIADIFPVFFFLVAALVCITTMNRMVEEQRTQIGVLKALGYGNGTIMSKYMIYSGLAAVLGCVTGFLLGTWGFPEIIWFVYGIMYSAGELSYVFDMGMAVVSLTVALLCSVGTTWLSCRVELGSNAATLMRPKAPKAGKRVFLERLPFIWRHLSFLRKVSVRNIFRYKKRLVMMVLGISGCTALLVTGFGITDSIANVAAQQFGEIQIYDMGVSLKEGADDGLEQELAELSSLGVEKFLCVMEKNMDIVTEKGVKSIYLVVADGEKMPQYLDMHTKQKEAIPYPETGEGVITGKIAAQYGIEAGDMLTLRDGEMNTMSVKITAVMENYIYNYVYVSEETWRQAMGAEPERKTVYVNLEEAADDYQAAAALMELEEISNVSINADMMERIGSMLQSLDIIVVVVILCAAGLAFIVLYNLTNINITERIREIATVKVLGFYKKETASYVFRENILLTVMGMMFGLVLGYFLHLYVMSEIQVDMIAFDIHVEPVSYVYSGLLTLIFAWFVNRFMGHRLESISMTESLKSVD